MTETAPKPKARRLIGAMIIILGLTAYVVLVATLGTTVIPNHWGAQLAFYGIAGVAWALPLRPLVAWINRED